MDASEEPSFDPDTVFQFDPEDSHSSSSSSHLKGKGVYRHSAPTSPDEISQYEQSQNDLFESRHPDVEENLAYLDLVPEPIVNALWSPGSPSTAGPSSYGSSSFFPPSPGASSTSPTSFETPLPLSTYEQFPSLRRRSLSNVSLRSSRSLAAKSFTSLQSKLVKSQAKLTRTLSGNLGKGEKPSSASMSPLSRANDSLELLQQASDTALSPPQAKVHNRSQSYPLPASGSSTPNELLFTFYFDQDFSFFAKDYFDEMLPRELRVRVFACLVSIYASEHQHIINQGRWTTRAASSSKNRWLLILSLLHVFHFLMFSKVSRTWQELVFDGQIWSSVDLHAFPGISPSLVDRILRLDWENFIAVSDFLSIRGEHMSYTQLTDLNLQGCSGLTTRALNYFLMRSPHLIKLNLRGQAAVRNSTDLHLGRCANLNAHGLRILTKRTLERGDVLLLTCLRLSGLKDIDDGVMSLLGKAAPFLEILDLSCCEDLHNSALEAFVEVGPEHDFDILPNEVEIVTLTSREAGREREDGMLHRRRVTHLRHLVLSSCPLLTDTACSNLSHAMPHLEFLRARWHRRRTARLDLEDCTGITDDVLSVLTPATTSNEQQTGHNLEVLNVAYGSELSEDALVALIRACPKLRVLEADNTRMNAVIVKRIHLRDARIVATDCRGIGETVIKEMSPTTRPRLGWVGYEAKKLARTECDEKKVVLKSFHSWQSVDAVAHARKRRKSRRAGNHGGGSSSNSDEDNFDYPGSRRWWSPGARRRVGNTAGPNGDGCLIM
ncbi:RNI-like protein [Flagelloscypha sp. PMI_526]|nr:RNI-like protein [Flagelloscypha sp. PMI_526]